MKIDRWKKQTTNKQDLKKNTWKLSPKNMILITTFDIKFSDIFLFFNNFVLFISLPTLLIMKETIKKTFRYVI